MKFFKSLAFVSLLIGNVVFASSEDPIDIEAQIELKGEGTTCFIFNLQDQIELILFARGDVVGRLGDHQILKDDISAGLQNNIDGTILFWISSSKETLASARTLKIPKYNSDDIEVRAPLVLEHKQLNVYCAKK